MADIRDKYPEFKPLTNNELELVLKMYDEHLKTPFTISNPSYYVSGAMVLLVCFMFVNGQKLSNTRLDLLGYPDGSYDKIGDSYNSPQKVCMITILASSVGGLGYVLLRTVFNSFVHENNYGCFYMSNAMLSGTVSIAASCVSIDVWQSLVISFIGCLLYSMGSQMLIKFEVDDPLEACLIYGV